MLTMKKFQVHTTVSSKHMELLNRFVETYGSQQKVLELALENMEDKFQPNPLSPEEKLWIQFAGVDTACFIQKESLRLLLETDDEELFQKSIDRDKPIEFQIEKYYHKPLKECSLKEIVDGLVVNARMAHWFELVDYKDEGDHFTMIMAHTLGINGSGLNKILMESVFKTYGGRFESTVSEKTFFHKDLQKLIIKSYSSGLLSRNIKIPDQ
jgi:hypothetical protein